MTSPPEIPESIRKFVKTVEGPVGPHELDAYSRLRDVEDKSYHLRTIVAAWSTQQEQDRVIRNAYSRWLAWTLSLQLVLVNTVFVLIGSGVLRFEAWVTNVFVVSVFGEVTGLVLIVVKYLFPQSVSKVLELLERLKG